MPVGYLVTLGDGSLDPGDSIANTSTSFTTSSTLGNGKWIYSGIDDIGNPVTNQSAKGTYYLATDGNVYFIPKKTPDLVTTAVVETAPAYTAPENIVDGTGGDNVIDTSYTDSDGDQVDDGTGSGTGGLGDIVKAGDGNDTVNSGAGDDNVYGGGGNDTIDGGTGNDTIYGDTGGGVTSTSESLNWSTVGADESSIAAGFTQTTGEIDVSVSFVSDGDNNPLYEVESTDTLYVGTGEPMSTTSSTYLYGQGLGATSTTTIDFAATEGSDLSNEVQNVIFRINDIDAVDGNHLDVVTVNAYDALGNPVTVSITPGSNDTASGNTITAGNVSDTQAQLGGSALIQIAGPVASIEIIYSNAEDTLTGTYTGTHAIWVTDIHFETVVPADGDDVLNGGAGDDIIYGEGGDDTITGGLGADTVSGGAGDDTLNLAQGDTATGGEGDDTFILTDLGEIGNINITGGEGSETLGDTLDFNGLLAGGAITYTNTDDAAGGLSGYAILLDGTRVDFTNIENIICFTAGTRLLTQHGETPVQFLRAGDMVVTRDHGLKPIRWIGTSTVPGQGKFAPIAINPAGLDGARRPLLVSPQHRFLFRDYRAELLFGKEEVLVSAKYMADGLNVAVRPCNLVTYVHIMLDRHEVIYAEGAATESFFAADYSISGVSAEAREEMFAAFPELRADVTRYGPTARRCLNRHEADLLLTSMRSERRRDESADRRDRAA